MKSLYRVAHISFRLLAGVLALSVAVSQTAFAAQSPDAPTQPVAASSAPSTIDVPAGTVIPLTLVSQIKHKSTKVGDTVRAEVAFPVTAGAQVVIPAGTFVEGVVTSTNQPVPTKKKKTRYAQAALPQPDVQIHFVRLVYANGYVAALDAMNTEARNYAPDAAVSPQFSEAVLPPAASTGGPHIAFYGGEGFMYSARASQPPFPYPPVPTLPPLPPLPGPPPGVVIGLGLGIPVALVALGVIFGLHHRGDNSDYVLYDAGWQFQMTLANPLTVDAGQVSAAEAMGPR